LVLLAASAFVVLAAEPSYLLIDTAVIGHLGTAQLGRMSRVPWNFGGGLLIVRPR